MLGEIFVAMAFTLGMFGAVAFLVLSPMYVQYITEATNKKTGESMEKINDYDRLNDNSLKQLLGIFEYLRKKKIKKRLRQIDRRIKKESSLDQPDKSLLNLLENARNQLLQELSKILEFNLNK